MSGMRFKSQCDYCSTTFFSSERDATVCPKCMRKYRLAPAKPATPKPAAPRPKPQRPLLPDRTILAPHPRILTDELKAAIIEEYDKYKDDAETPLRLVHGKIAFELKIKKHLVAQVIRELRGEPLPPQVTLTEDQKRDIVEIYRDYVESGERPPAGRRKTIAAQMELPYGAVAQVINEWSQKMPKVDTLTREQRFDIEKQYLRHLEKKDVPVHEICEVVAEEMGLDRWQTLRWIDLLYDGSEELSRIPDPTPEQREAIEAAYEEYLASKIPPEPPLHQLFSEKTGATPKQVHKVLLQYRLVRQQAAQAAHAAPATAEA